MKLHLKFHFTFIYAFIPRFYSIACLSKLRSIVTSLGISRYHREALCLFIYEYNISMVGYPTHRYIIFIDERGKKASLGYLRNCREMNITDSGLFLALSISDLFS